MKEYRYRKVVEIDNSYWNEPKFNRKDLVGCLLLWWLIIPISILFIPWIYRITHPIYFVREKIK